MIQPTDTEILDFLEKENNLNCYTGKCVFRLSYSGRGWRLHETSHPRAQASVRAAIIEAMVDQKKREV